MVSFFILILFFIYLLIIPPFRNLRNKKIIEVYGGFVDKAQKETQQSIHISNSGSITGSQIGNQGRDFSFESNATKTTNEVNMAIPHINSMVPNDTSAGWLKKSVTAFNSIIVKIIIGIIIGFAVAYIGWYVNRYLDKTHAPKLHPAKTGISVKKL